MVVPPVPVAGLCGLGVCGVVGFAASTRKGRRPHRNSAIDGSRQCLCPPASFAGRGDRGFPLGRDRRTQVGPGVASGFVGVAGYSLVASGAGAADVDPLRQSRAGVRAAARRRPYTGLDPRREPRRRTRPLRGRGLGSRPAAPQQALFRGTPGRWQYSGRRPGPLSRRRSDKRATGCLRNGRIRLSRQGVPSVRS